jgi:type III pantothenate kinase
VKVLQRVLGHLVINTHSIMMRNDSLLNFGAVENAGIDRLLGAIGAMQLVAPPLITVDCGTAVTVNAVSAERVFVGGAIFAGITTQLFGLAKQTAGIPEMPYTEPTSSIGINTQQSLMVGITASVVGGVTQLIRSMQANQFGGMEVPVVIAGGEGQYLMRGLQENGIKAQYYPHIVTDGVLTLLAHAKVRDIQDCVIEKIRT